jgi:DNA polymerase-1
MYKKWLVLDCNYLCHRAKHSMGGLSNGNTPTGVIYGFIKTVIYLQEMFNTHRVIFCWDSIKNNRYDIFPGYKQKRKSRYNELTSEEEEFEKAFRSQMKKLRRYYLKEIGYRNVFCQKGFESDDLIASICKNLPDDQQAVIITSDQDMYQCIKHNISFHSPQKKETVTLQGFTKQYGITPKEWGMLKAIVGCSTDEVPGVRGVGEKTCLKYLKGELKDTTKAYQSITSKEGIAIYKRNRPLVILPFKGTKVFKLKKDRISEEGWKNVMKKLGMKSLREKAPIFRRK